MYRELSHLFPPGRLVVALTCLTCLAAGASVPVATGTEPLDKPDYAGRVTSEGGGRVLLRVYRRHGKLASVRFTAKNFAQRCEDGSTRRPNLNPLRAGFDAPKLFDRDSYSYASTNRIESYYRIHGRLLSGGRARGFIFYYLNRADPPGTSSDSTECTTAGKLRWKAKRVGDNDEQA